MRGKVCNKKAKCSYSGITPAYAGKSCYRNLIAVDPRDHPRLCGEKKSISSCQHTALGSPPPMRGKVETLYTELSRVGITPAYAGKSSFSLILSICGSGSPPPMRGKAIAAFPRHHASRITPAYAGKSSQRICERIETKDHPRLCGEKFADNRYIYIEIGSPPPMRGKVKHRL